MTAAGKKGWLRALWVLATGGLGLAFILGVVAWGGFNTVMEWTNREAFCISCHEMKDNVYAEYRNTVHYQNRTGVRATCPDCHVPKEWGPKMVRKIQASNEVLHKVLGTIDTPAKFNARRGQMAANEWTRMKRNDSQECRNCHNFNSMDYAEQNRRGGAAHQQAVNRGETCIDCHKGIAHTLPDIEQHIGAPKAHGAGSGNGAGTEVAKQAVAPAMPPASTAR